MLYKFKSRATADLIMLESNGRQVLQIVGKEPGGHGIITAQQIPAAIAALEAAVAEDEARRRALAEEQAQEGAPDDEAAATSSVTLRQRVVPMIEMLRRSAAEEHDVIW